MSAIQGRSINGPRNGLPPSGGYSYQGTGEDTLTPQREMTRWYRQVRAAGANPHPTNQADIARLAAAENALALGRLPRAKRPAPQQVTRPVPLTAMSVACWEDDCAWCPGGPCKCACHDEPPPRPAQAVASEAMDIYEGRERLQAARAEHSPATMPRNMRDPLEPPRVVPGAIVRELTERTGRP